MTPGPSPRDRVNRPATRLLLEGEIETPSGLRRLELHPGDAYLVEGADADIVMAALAAPHPATRLLRLEGRSIERRGLPTRVRQGLVPVGQEPVAPDVAIRDHLAAVCGAGRADALVAEAPLLAGRGGDPAGVLSGGERRVLGLLRAIALEPIVVVLDRVAAGLDDEVRHWTGDLVARWRGAGMGVVIRPARIEERDWAA